MASEGINRLATAYQRDDDTGELVVEDGPDGYLEPATDVRRRWRWAVEGGSYCYACGRS